MNKGIIFDLDGTLWDSSEQVAAAWSETLKTRPETDRQVTGEDMRGYMGKTLEAIADLMLPELPKSLRMEIMKECCDNEEVYLRKVGGRLFPNLEKELERLCGKYSLFIVSNCQSGYIETFLEYHKLGKYFADFECPGGTGLGKGENIKIVMERGGIEKAVYVGDTQGDCDSADFAGIPFIHAAYGFGKINREVPAVHSFSEIYGAAGEILDK